MYVSFIRRQGSHRSKLASREASNFEHAKMLVISALTKAIRGMCITFCILCDLIFDGSGAQFTSKKGQMQERSNANGHQALLSLFRRSKLQ